jgi:triacylglycerol lipase
MASTGPVPVLLHGFLGFTRIGPITYFRGVASALRKAGIDPLVPELPATGSVAERAAELAAILRQHRAPTFALIGHSMGGLDARFAIANLDPDHRIRSLLTVATPHHGSAIAQRVLTQEGPPFGLLRRYWSRALEDLDPQTRLREPIPDRADVAYVSYATMRQRHELPIVLRRLADLIAENNDGLVPVSSATWGDFRGMLRADHFEIVGWSLGLPNRTSGRPYKHIAFWRRAVREAIGCAMSRTTT